MGNQINDIRKIVKALNELSKEYKIGKLQEIRKGLKRFKRKPVSTIFKGISEEYKKDYTFHCGGRTELQFNIGFDKGGFRYGIAFSLEPSHTLPDPEILYPLILKLNCIIREHIEWFKGYKMWMWTNMGRTEIHQVREILPEESVLHNFIFIGKLQKPEDINYDEILSTFDDLLKVYIEVQRGDYYIEPKSSEESVFIFKPSNRKLPSNREVSLKEKKITINARHSLLQNKLSEELKEEFGEENVTLENPFNRNKIDLVVNNKSEYIFFEVKVASSVQSCIRQAIGQLMEYAFWPGKKHAEKIVIAGEYSINNEGKRYISFLNNEFNLPVEYRQIKL